MNHDSLVALLPSNVAVPYIPPKEDADGWSEWQLWVLMQEFGSAISMEMRPPFETNIQILDR